MKRIALLLATLSLTMTGCGINSENDIVLSTNGTNVADNDSNKTLTLHQWQELPLGDNAKLLSFNEVTRLKDVGETGAYAVHINVKRDAKDNGTPLFNDYSLFLVDDAGREFRAVERGVVISDDEIHVLEGSLKNEKTTKTKDGEKISSIFVIVQSPKTGAKYVKVEKNSHNGNPQPSWKMLINS